MFPSDRRLVQAAVRRHTHAIAIPAKRGVCQGCELMDWTFYVSTVSSNLRTDQTSALKPWAPILPRMKKPATRDTGRGAVHRIEYTISPRTTATSVVATSRVRRENRHRIQGIVASRHVSKTSGHNGITGLSPGSRLIW